MPLSNRIPDSAPSTPSLSSGGSRTPTPFPSVHHSFAANSPVSDLPGNSWLTLQFSPFTADVNLAPNLDLGGSLDIAGGRSRLLLRPASPAFLQGPSRTPRRPTPPPSWTPSSAASSPGLRTPDVETVRAFQAPVQPFINPEDVYAAAMAGNNDSLVDLAPLTAWYAHAGRSVPDNFDTAWHFMPSRPLQTFMGQLHALNECASGQDPAVTLHIANWLDTLTDNAVLRRQTLCTAREHAHWVGRSALVLHALQREQIVYEAATGVYDYRLGSLVEAGRRDFRLMQLERLAHRRAETLRASGAAPVSAIEVYLALRLGLDRELALGLGSRGDGGRLSNGEQLDLQDAANTVLSRENEDFDQYLLREWAPWQQTMQRIDPTRAARVEERIAARKESLNDTMQSEMERLMEEKPAGWLDTVTDMKNRFEAESQAIERDVWREESAALLESRGISPSILSRQDNTPYPLVRPVL